MISDHFPYTPITITVAGYRASAEAFVDTGFEGNLLIPTTFLPSNIRPDGNTVWTMPDGRRVVAPGYRAVVGIGALGHYSVVISSLGDEILIRRRLIERFIVTFERVRRLIIDA